MHQWDDILALHGGVLLRRELPGLSEALSRAVRRGRLAAVLPGTYVDARVASDQLVRIAAVARRYPDAVLCDETAARLTFWPQIPGGTVQVAGVQVRSKVGGYQFHRRAVAEERVSARSRIRMTAPAMTAIDLAAATDGESIDRVLRSRTATLADLRAALCASPGRIGNVRRRQVLLDSRDEPWSTAERLAHRALRGAGIRGWRANLRVRCRGGTYYLDIAFPGARVAIEIDGREWHSDRGVFETDRYRQNELVLDGWIVVRVTWDMLANHPDGVITTVRRALRRASRREVHAG